MMTPSPVIRDAGDVDRLLARLDLLATVRRVSLDLDSLRPDESRAFQTRLNRLGAACGCEMGALMAVLGVAGYFGHLWGTVGSPSHWSSGDVLWGGAVFLVAATIGKLVGLAGARIRLIRQLERLRERINRPIGLSIDSR